MAEFESINLETLGTNQKEIAKRLGLLWSAVKQLRQDKFPHHSDSNLPKNFRQAYIAIFHRIQGIIVEMLNSPTYIPLEESSGSGVEGQRKVSMSEIKVMVWKFLETNENLEVAGVPELSHPLLMSEPEKFDPKKHVQIDAHQIGRLFGRLKILEETAVRNTQMEIHALTTMLNVIQYRQFASRKALEQINARLKAIGIEEQDLFKF